MIVTKRHLKEFVKSYEPFYKVGNLALVESLNKLNELIYRFFLFGKDDDYVLEEGSWQYNDVMFMEENNLDQGRFRGCNLYEYYQKWIRDNIINSVIV